VVTTAIAEVLVEAGWLTLVVALLPMLAIAMNADLLNPLPRRILSRRRADPARPSRFLRKYRRAAPILSEFPSPRCSKALEERRRMPGRRAGLETLPPPNRLSIIQRRRFRRPRGKVPRRKN